eukprot:4332544-Amphidinium_carterae.1
MFQDLSYDAMLNLLDEEEMKDLTEYQLTLQYLNYLIYLEITTPLLQKRENTLLSSRKPSTTTAESYSTP